MRRCGSVPPDARDQAPAFVRPRPSRRIGGKLGLCALPSFLLIALPGATRASQAEPCDSALTKLATAVNGYRQRGDRCEGLYAQQVSGTTVFLASLTEAFEDYDLQSTDSLTVRWSLPPKSTAGLQLRAETLKHGRYYRMDTVRSLEAGAYRWPSGLLRAERIPRRELGVIGWTQVTIGDVPSDVYVPLQIRQQHAASACGTYDVVLWPGEQLTEVYVSLAPVRADGRLGAFVRQDSLNYGFYPAESPIKFQIKQRRIGPPGLYYLKIGARLGSGGTSTKEYRLYLSGAAACG